MIGALMFIIIQLVLIIDFAHSWAESWTNEHKNSNDSQWFYALLAATGFFYILTLVTIIISYSYYTGSVMGQCKLHEFFISFNMLICLGWVGPFVVLLPYIVYRIIYENEKCWMDTG